MRESETTLLKSQVDQLMLSEECIVFLKAMKINRLQDLIDIGWTQFKSEKDFDYISFNEIVSYLRKNDLLYLMEPLD